MSNNEKPYSTIKVVTKGKTEGTDQKGIKILYDLDKLNDGQKKLVKAINTSAIVVAIGRSGVGKTLLTTIEVVKLLKEHKTRKMICTRPNLVISKDGSGGIDTVSKYLEQVLGTEKLNECLSTKKIQSMSIDEIRNITFKNTTLILDQAQFVTKYELYTILSRAGKGSATYIQ